MYIPYTKHNMTVHVLKIHSLAIKVRAWSFIFVDVELVLRLFSVAAAIIIL